MSAVSNKVTEAEIRPHAVRYPDMGTGPVPTEPYVSQDYFDLECEKIFKHVWLRVATANEMPNAGDFFVRSITALNTSILIVRGKDGIIRAFHNFCRHRGSQIGASTPGEFCKQNTKAFTW